MIGRLQPITYGQSSHAGPNDMPKTKPYYAIYAFFLIMSPLTGKSLGETIGGDNTALGGVAAGLMLSLVGAFLWVKIARTEQAALLAALTATSATVQSWSLAAGPLLSDDMRLITTIGVFLLTWYSFNRLTKNYVDDIENDPSVPSNSGSIQPSDSTNQEEQEIATPG